MKELQADGQEAPTIDPGRRLQKLSTATWLSGKVLLVHGLPNVRRSSPQRSNQHSSCMKTLWAAVAFFPCLT